MHNKTNLYRRIAGTFFIFSLLVALAVFYFSFSWATVVVKPRFAAYNAAQSFALTDKDVHNADEVKASAYSDVLTAEGVFSATGSKTETGKLAGTVTIVNTTGTPQPLRATTRLLSANGVLFRLDDYALVPARGQVTAAVHADAEGDIGTIDSGRFTIPGLWEGLQTQIYGQGFVQTQPAVHEIKLVQSSDIEQAKKTLLNRLQTKFQDTLKTTTAGDTNQYQAIDSSVLSSTVSAKAGAQAEQLKMTLKARFVAVRFDKKEVYDQFVEMIKAKLASNQELIPPDLDKLDYALTIKGSALSQMQLRVSGQAKKVTAQDSRPFDAQALAGKSQAEIIAYFANFDDIESVSVRLYPFWVFRAPALADHINILLDTK